MNKLLHVLPSLNIGGAECLVLNILKDIDRKKFDVALCVLFPPQGTRLEDELLKMKIPTYYLGKHMGLDLRILGRLKMILTDFKPDIIHTHGYILRYAVLPTLLNRVPIRIHTIHGDVKREAGLLEKLIPWLAFNLFNFVPISVADSVALSVREVYGISSNIIYNGIPTVLFKNKKIAIANKKTDRIFINISSFRPDKNHQMLIDAFTMAIKNKRNIKLFLVGDGPLRSDIEKVVKEKNIQNNVIFFGFRNDIPKLLEKSDVYVSSSKYEGLSLSVLEAMAAGKPIIATEVGDNPRLIDGGISGLLVPNMDVKALTTAILKLANNPAMIKKMGEEGRKRACEKFDITLTTRRYEELYLDRYKKYMNLK